MTAAYPTPSRPDEPLDSSLRLVVDSATTVTGFGAAAIGLVDDGRLHVVAVSGSEEARALLEAIDPGALDEETSAFSEQLVAPLRDGDGLLRGVLALVLPDGRTPDPSARERLAAYARQASRAIAAAVERARLAGEVRQAEFARELIREAGRGGTLDEIMRNSAPALMGCFEAVGVWWQLNDAGSRGDGVWSDERTAAPPAELRGHLTTVATQLWSRGDVLVLGPDQVRNVRHPQAARLGLAWVVEQGLASVLIAPIGVADRCHGLIGLARQPGRAPWSESELRTLRLLCGDIGRALHNGLELQREQSLVQRLRVIDRKRSELLRTVSHELKNPLSAILGTTDLLLSEPAEGAAAEGAGGADAALAAAAIARIERGADRMTRIIADLTTFSAADARHRSEPVDLVAIVRDVCDLMARSAAQREQTLRVSVPDEPVIVRGDAALLDRVVLNLVSNAVKYTGEGGEITVSVAASPTPVLSVRDTGIGISEADQQRLFTEFFRSTDPRATTQPGTGLGLAIVERIVAGHGGSLAVDSRLGEGSTFSVTLPGAR